MSLLEDLHAAHKARQRRFSAAAIMPVALLAPAPIVEVLPEPMRKPIREWRALPLKSQPITHVQSLCCMYFNVPRFDLISPGRTMDLVYPRQVAMYLAKTLGLGSLPEIGRRFGGRDHTTVLHAVQKIGRLVKSDWTVAYDVARIEATL